MLTFNTATGIFLVVAFSFGLFGMANLSLPTEAELWRLEGESD